MKEPKEPISDEEFLRLDLLHRQRSDPDRRSPYRVEKPVEIKPSVAGARIVNWKEYQELVAKGEAKYPPQSYGAKRN